MEPTGETGRLFRGHPLPPDIPFRGEGHVGEDRVLAHAQHGVAIGLHRGAGRHPEKTKFGVDRIKAAVLAELHPGNIVADRLHLPAGQGGDEHGEIGLAAGARKSPGDIALLAFGTGQAEDQHMLGQPPPFTRHDRGDAQGEALFAEQGVAAVAAAVRPDHLLFGKVDDIAVLRVAGPGHILFTGPQGFAHRMQAGDEGIVAQDIQHLFAHACHDAHVGRHIPGVGKFNADLADGRAQGPHAVGNDVHGAPAHAAVIDGEQECLHLIRIAPVVGQTGILALA